MTGTVVSVTGLGAGPWPTVDPFLFCVHHLDHYPAGDGRLRPAASLDGRPLGSDFTRTDGWNMYHGRGVPGFPAHPHRGFETVTVVRRGIVDHADSLGAAARFGGGDVQWITAGAGLVHSEMFPLLDDDGPNTLEMFQLWLNLPAVDKMADPHFAMLWATDVPLVEGPGVRVAVVAGMLDGEVPPAPPPRSWAARPDSHVAIWSVRLDAGATWTAPLAHPSARRTLYLHTGPRLDVDGERVDGPAAVEVVSDRPCRLTAGDDGVEVLVLQGRPIGEPVAQYGPFVLNDRAGVAAAFEDYRRTGFGGWPWPADDPDHGPDAGRFARHADGRVEERSPLTTGR